jgi:hypothetical protein
MRHWVSLVVLAAFARTAGGQTDRLGVGARVRLSVPNISQERLVGRIERRNADTLVVSASRAGPSPYVVPLSEIRKAEVSLGHQRLIPALVGAGIGGAIGYPLYDGIIRHVSIAGGSTKYRHEVAVGTCATLAVFGAGIGALVGHERWEKLHVAPAIQGTRAGDAWVVIRMAF